MLTTDEMRFFKRNGYLIKRGVLDPVLLERASQPGCGTAHRRGPPPRRSRHLGWAHSAKTKKTPTVPTTAGGFRWNFREPGGEEWMVRLLATDPKVWAMAEQMLGKGQLVQPERIRGIYCTLPYGDHPPQELGCPGAKHDGHPFHLGVVGYIDGRTAQTAAASWSGPKAIAPSTRPSLRNTSATKTKPPTKKCAPSSTSARPSIPTAKPATSSFWHHRLGHMASPNTSRQLRQAVLYDFLKKDIEQTQQEPPQEDMWRDWSDAMRAITI